MEFVYKSQAEIADMTDEQREDYAVKKREHEEALIKKKAKEEAEKLIEKSKKETKKETEELLKKSKDEYQKELDKVSAQVKKASQISKNDGKLTLKDAFSKVFSDNIEVIKSYKGQGKEVLTTKALSPANFGSGTEYADFFTQREQTIYRDPYAPIWLRNIFPNATSTGDSITYLKRKASTGKAGVWTRDGENTPKPDVTSNFEKVVAPIDWIAGLTDVPKEMLQDASFLQSWVPENLIYGEDGIFAAENAYILDYIKNNAVDFTAPAGVDYDVPLERVIAAAFGQLGSKYMQPTHILINNWDYLTYLEFNKADGSGQYNYPGFNVRFINGQMFINNLTAVPVPDVDPGEAYVVAAGLSSFVTRVSPSVEMFEQHKDNVAQNLVTFRAEERVAFFTRNEQSLVKVDLTTD